MEKRINKAGIELIKKYEGLKLTAYRCDGNVWTIGYGTTRIHGRPIPRDLVITEEQSEEYLLYDIAVFESGVDKLVTVELNDNQFSALVSFAYNLGLGNLKQSTLLKKVNSDPADPSIRTEFEKWVNAGGKKLKGLILRRSDEADLFFS